MNLINHLGVGTVASTKNTNTGEIMVHLPSQSPMADGRIVANVEQKQESGLNARGETETSTVMVSNTVPAVWNSFGEANRKTPPDVREGSKVALYQVSGQNQYYWTTSGFNSETFRMETIVWGYQSNPAVAADTPFDVNNFYTVQVDTRTGCMSARTTQNNGEKSAFDVRIDGGNGRVDLGGSNGSVFSLDDANQTLTYANKPGLVLRADKKKFGLYAPDSISLSADEKITLFTKVINIQCQEVNVKAEKARVAIPDTEWEGDIKLNGNVDQEGFLKQKGNIMTSGVVQGLSGIKSAITDLDTHGNTGVEAGKDVSAPPLPVPQPPILGL